MRRLAGSCCSLLLVQQQQPRRWQAWRCITVSYPGRTIRSDQILCAARRALSRSRTLLDCHAIAMAPGTCSCMAQSHECDHGRSKDTGSLSILSFAGVEVPSLWRSSTSSSIPHHSSVMQSPEYADTYTTCRRHLPSRTVQAAVGAGAGKLQRPPEGDDEQKRIHVGMARWHCGSLAPP